MQILFNFIHNNQNIASENVPYEFRNYQDTSLLDLQS